MVVTTLTDRSRIAAFLRREPERNIYALGDLDDFYWPSTEWYGLEGGHPKQAPSSLSAVALIYHGPGVDTLHCLQQDVAPAADLLHALSSRRGVLSDRCEAHLAPGLVAAFEGDWSVQSRGEHLKLSLDPSRLPRVPDPTVDQLSPADRAAALALYDESYPDNWFDPRMLETGRYVGIWDGDRLVSIAGVHVYSREYGVAALGNVTTLPAYRRRGLGSRVTAALSRLLLDDGVLVGLNVHAENQAALACYYSLGFRETARYLEVVLHRRT